MKPVFAAIAAVAVTLASGATVTGQTSLQSAPTLLRLDGALLGPTGTPRTGPVLLVASLYANRDDAAPLWVEQQVVTADAAGRYSIVVGATLPDGIPQSYFIADAAASGHWMGIAVQGEPEQPRIMLVSVPYALRAREADTLAGRTATDFVTASNLTDSVKAALAGQTVGIAGGSTIGLQSVTTTNALAKFTDTNGTTGDSTIVDTGGSVGVGTTAPADTLHVNNAFGGGLRLTRTADGVGTGTLGYLDFANSQRNAEIAAVEDGTADSAFVSVSTRETQGALTERLRVNSNGNVGIGTANPIDTFQVNSSHGGGVRLTRTTDGTGTATLGYLDFANSQRNVEIAAIEDGTADSGLVWFATRASGGGLTERMRISSAGNVGIGTTVPATKLDVAGDLNSTGTVSAASFSGSGAALTGIPAANLTGVVSTTNLPIGTSAGTVAAGNDARFSISTIAPLALGGGNTISFSPSASVSMNGQKMTNMASPTASSDAATKGYVDASTATIASSATDPSSPSAGQLYFNTVLKNVMVFDGSAWRGLVAPPTPMIGGGGPVTNLNSNVGYGAMFSDGGGLVQEADCCLNPMGQSGKLTNFRVSLKSAPGSGQTVVLTVRKNASDTGVTCTVADLATTCTDLVDTVSFSAGDRISVRSDRSSGAATGQFKWVALYDLP